MSVQEQAVTSIITALPEGTFLGEALFFNGALTYAESSVQVQGRLMNLVEELAKQASNTDIFPRIESAKPVVGAIELELTPKHGLIGWEEPLLLPLPVVSWQETPRHHVGYIPPLGLEVVAQNEEAMLERARVHARLLVNRMRVGHDLQHWAKLARRSEIQLGPHRIRVDPTPPAQSAKRESEEDQDDQQATELSRSASDLSRLRLEPAYEINPQLQRLAEALTSSHRRPVLLVGPSGVGKTAVVHEFARQRQRFGMGTRVIWQTDGPRLVAGMTGFGMWQERCTKVVEEVRKSDAILFLGNLVQLMQVGQHEGNEQGIASFFKPYLMQGAFHAIAECTAEQRKLVEMQDPNLLSLFEEIHLQEPDREGRKRILQAVANDRGKEARITISDIAIQRVDDLHQRFATYSVAPGRPVRFVKNLIQSATPKAMVGQDEVTRSFANETGLPLFMIDDTVAFDPDKTRQWFGTRVIGQSEAVKRVTDVLTVVKANLSRPSRPIGSLLFIGPTGVGKTQLAKSMAEYLFGDADRMTRFDMSEYNSASAVIRLTQAPSGSDSAMGCGEGLLTAKVREQPFGVLLFDEFEKAHPSFFDLLLQVLGEGRLTDGTGRVADFTNTVIIMTSNLGAQAFQTDRFGFATTDAADQSEHFVEAVRDALRPELFNRIDRIVPFDPLGREQVRAIVARDLDQVRQRDGLALRNIELIVDDQAIDLLVENSYDAKLGARPLQRAIERRVLAPLADQINQYARDTALQAVVSVKQGMLHVNVSTLSAENDKPAHVSVTRSPIAPNLRLVTDLRRKAQQLVSCSSVIEMRNEVVRLQRIQSRRVLSKRADAWTDPELQKLPRLEALVTQIDDCRTNVESAEDDLAARLYTGASNTPKASEVARLTKQQWRQTLLDVYCKRFKSADELLIGVYSDVPVRLLPLIETYWTVAHSEGTSIDYSLLFTWNVNKTNRPKDGAAIRELKDPIDAPVPTKFREDMQIVWRSASAPLVKPITSMPRPNVFGVLLRTKGPYATALLSAEAGAHRFRGRSKIGHHCFVDTSGESITKYRPPELIEDSVETFCESAMVRRIYDTKSSTTEDKLLNKRTGWSMERSTQILSALIIESRENRLEDMIRS